MTSCQSSSDVIAIHGVDKDKLTVFRKLEVDPAQLAAFKDDTAGALVGERIAARYGWKIGQNVMLTALGNISFNVRGIFKRRGSADDFLIFTGRRFLQEADGEQGISHYVLVKPGPGVDQTALCRSIENLPLTVKTAAQPEHSQLMTILDQLYDLVRLSRGMIAIIIVVVLIAVGNAISMATRDRFREFGILRTLGFGKPVIMCMVLGEGFLQGLLGAFLGCLVVQVLASAHLVRTVTTCAVTVDFYVSAAAWMKVLLGVAVAAVLGSLLPAWNAARLDIVTALRPEE
jgi:putative ABC transport system permease protein